MSPLNSTGMAAANQKCLRKYRVQSAAKSVAKVPKTQSQAPNGLARLAKKQPKVTPTTPSGRRIGSRVSASETRNCIGPKVRGCSASAATAYMAAIIAIKAIERREIFMNEHTFLLCTRKKRPMAPCTVFTVVHSFVLRQADFELPV